MNIYSFEEGSMTSIMNESGWKQLKQRRQENRRIILHKGLNGYAHIPISDINQNKRKQRKGHNQQFQIPHVIGITDIYKQNNSNSTIGFRNKQMFFLNLFPILILILLKTAVYQKH